MSDELIITFNAGSSSIKFGLFNTDLQTIEQRARGIIDFRAHPLRLTLSDGPMTFNFELGAAPHESGVQEIMKQTFQQLSKQYDLNRLVGAGHRVVHGGEIFSGPATIDAASLRSIARLTPLAPLHQPPALRLIHALQSIMPNLPQSASFDTAFHSTISETVRRFAIPRNLHNQGVKRYGFHGLSYKFIANELKCRASDIAHGKIVIAHLGSGASLCGVDKGVSRDSSMGFSTLDGIPMATRSGALDPGVLLHLLGFMGCTIDNVSDILYQQSGLLGVSGVSADIRDLIASNESAAKEAVDLFCLRIAGETARIAATLGGLDALVFTAGIGEHQPKIRQRVATHLKWLGLKLDAAANADGAEIISSADSLVKTFVLATNEEKIIAEETLQTLTHKETLSECRH